MGTGEALRTTLERCREINGTLSPCYVSDNLWEFINPTCYGKSHKYSSYCAKCGISDKCIKEKIKNDFRGKEYWLYKRARAKND